MSNMAPSYANMISIPKTVAMVISELNASGYEAYIVGGCVRDAVIGKAPSDWDIAAGSDPCETKAVFSRFKTVDDGIKHGTVRVIIRGRPIEITTFRTDGSYSDGRRPDYVVFTKSLESDLARRDFTVNAMAYSPVRGIIDPFGGLLDIQNKIIRCVRDPRERFSEDALRILRALRFSSVLSYTIEENTAYAARTLAHTLSKISAERITAELLKLLEGPYAAQVCALFADILGVVLPLSCFSPEAISRLKYSPQDAALRLALLFEDAASAQVALSRLRLSNAFSGEVVALINQKNVDIPDSLPKAKRFLSSLPRSVRPEKLILFWSLSGRDAARADGLFSRIFENGDCVRLSDLKVGGRDLAGLGIPPGKELGAALRALLDAVIDGELPNEKDALIKYTEQNIKNGG